MSAAPASSAPALSAREDGEQQTHLLSQERRNALFDVEAMKIVWAGGAQELSLSQRMSHLVSTDPVFRKDNRVQLSRTELLQSTLKKAAHAWDLIQNLHLNEKEAAKLRQFIDEPTYAGLHWGMFIPALKGQATDEQQKKWLPLAYKQAIIGCYAQTELGHGSNVQGLETTATFDPSSDEFVLDSPTLTSTKWWPGGLGKVATHAIVFARLLTDGHDYGVHAFIVQVRSLDDHQPLFGVIVADIGVKFGNGGYNTMDNGLLRLDHVRIPRDNMLMRLAKVTKEGKYIRSNVPKQLAYGAMVFVRRSIVIEASDYLSRAVTIAVRYSAVRCQFGKPGKESEIQVLDYMTQQHRLFPLLATAYAYRFLGVWMDQLYSDVMDRLQRNDFSTLPEVHACTAGLKSITTSVTAVAKFLMKTISQVRSGNQIPSGTAAYLGNRLLMKENCKVMKGADWMETSVLQNAFEARSARMANRCAAEIAEAVNPETEFSELSAELIEVSRAHCELIVVTKFIDALKGDFPGEGVKRQLDILCRVYAISLLTAHAGDFLSIGYLSERQITLAKQQLRALFREVRLNAVALVDAFDHCDYYLGSILGRYDGDVYTNLYKEAWNDPLNFSYLPEGYNDYIRPLFKQTSKL